MGRVSGKVAIVTGGARGQGAEHARLLAAEGATVVITDILDEQGTSLAKEIANSGATTEYVSHDVSDDDGWSTLAAQTVEKYGGIDILVNNAGIVAYSTVVDCSNEEWNRAIAVNQTGVFYGMRTVVPHMRQAGRGSIVNVSSVYGGMRGVDGYIAYGATKAAVYFMTMSAAMTYGRDGVRVNAIAPGALDTPMLREEMKHLGIPPEQSVANAPIARLAHASETSTAVLYLASDESSYVTGILIPVDGGLTLGTP